jgi:pimeloyl-ACP methyl ester carboxylesterase
MKELLSSFAAVGQRTARRGPLVHDDTPSAAPPSGPPGGLIRTAELTAPWQFARLLLKTPALRQVPRTGAAAPVVDIPGWRAPEGSGAPLRSYLRWLDYDSMPWGLGTNHGNTGRDTERLTAKVLQTAEASGQPVALVGWSLGGVVAREVARQAPDAVSRVITYGSPVIGGPTHTIGASSFGAEEAERITRLIEKTEAESPIKVPVSVIYTKRDGIVDWRACIDRTSLDVEHIEVASTHLGLGIDPDVWRIIAGRLAARN